MAAETKVRRTRKPKSKPEAKPKIKPAKAPALYAGAPVPALRVFRRDMPEFKKCKAQCWLLISETTYSFANTYGEQLKASFDARHYTWALTDAARKKIDKKLEADFVEIDVIEWPTWITNAAATKRTRKAK